MLAVTSLGRTSVTIDEYAHLPAGLAYWQTGSFALYHHNPPLVKMLAAVPVLLSRPSVDYGGSWARARTLGVPPDHVAFADEFMRANAARYFDLFDRGRCVIVLLSIAAGLLIYLWGRDLWGEAGGLLAAALWSLDPNVLAHAGVITTDVGGALAIAASVYVFWRWLRAPGWKGAALCGAVLGIAQLVKFTALILPVLFLLLALARRLAAPRDARRAPRGVPLAQALLIGGMALFVLDLGYGFQEIGRPLGDFPFLSPRLTVPRRSGAVPYHPNAFYQGLYRERQNRFEGTVLGRLPTPLPEQYVLGFDEQLFESNIGLPGGGFAVYLNGVFRRSGWYTYYLWALALKVPIATWLLVLGAFASALLVPGLRGRIGDEAAWLFPAAAILTTASLNTGLDLGVRYVLPMFPFLCVGAGRLGRLLQAPGRGRLAGAGLLACALAWNVAETAGRWPHYLSYFNELAGGPAGGHRYLLDSNLDWGQDLLELRRWLDAHPQGEPIALAYFGAVDPRLAGLRFRMAPRDPRVVPAARLVPGEPETLRPGLYAVSVNFVQGLPLRVQADDGSMVPADQDAYGYFRSLEPVARAGWSIRIYRLEVADVEAIRRLWGASVTPP